MRAASLIAHLAVLAVLALLTPGDAQAQGGAATWGASASARLDAVCARAKEYGCYVNHKYGYVAAWPRKLLSPQGESDSGDGQRFASADGRAEMACWASFASVTGRTLEQVFREAREELGAQAGYKRIARDFFVVSGLKDGRIFYRKTIFAGEVEAGFQIEYPQELKEEFDPVVRDLAAAFTVDESFAARAR